MAMDACLVVGHTIQVATCPFWLATFFPTNLCMFHIDELAYTFYAYNTLSLRFSKYGNKLHRTHMILWQFWVHHDFILYHLKMRELNEDWLM